MMRFLLAVCRNIKFTPEIFVWSVLVMDHGEKVDSVSFLTEFGARRFMRESAEDMERAGFELAIGGDYLYVL